VLTAAGGTRDQRDRPPGTTTTTVMTTVTHGRTSFGQGPARVTTSAVTVLSRPGPAGGWSVSAWSRLACSLSACSLTVPAVPPCPETGASPARAPSTCWWGDSCRVAGNALSASTAVARIHSRFRHVLAAPLQASSSAGRLYVNRPNRDEPW